MSLRVNRKGELKDGVDMIHGVNSTIKDVLFVGVERMNQKALMTFLPGKIFFTTANTK